MRRILLSGLLIGLCGTPANAEMYTGGVSSDNLQEDIQADIPVAPNRIYRMNTEQPCIRTGIQQPIYNMSASTIDIQAIRFGGHTPKYDSARSNSKLSAIGIQWTMDNRTIIMYVDPASSVYGIIFPGDRVISLNNQEIRQAIFARKNYGQSGTYADMVFQKSNGEIVRLSVLRQAVTNFSPKMQRILLPIN